MLITLSINMRLPLVSYDRLIIKVKGKSRMADTYTSSWLFIINLLASRLYWNSIVSQIRQGDFTKPSLYLTSRFFSYLLKKPHRTSSACFIALKCRFYLQRLPYRLNTSFISPNFSTQTLITVSLFVIFTKPIFQNTTIC